MRFSPWIWSTRSVSAHNSERLKWFGKYLIRDDSAKYNWWLALDSPSDIPATVRFDLSDALGLMVVTMRCIDHDPYIYSMFGLLTFLFAN